MTKLAAKHTLLDPLDEARIAEGHRQLLATFRGFLDAEDAGGAPDLESVRAAVAFLRQSVLPFSRWEEGCFAPRSLLAEDTSFGHAFLAAETEALAAAASRLVRERPGTERGRSAAAAVRRHQHRIEAVLEVHVFKAEDRASLLAVVPPDAPAWTRPDGGTVGDSHPAKQRPRAMSSDEADAMLRAKNWGLLSTAAEGQPYAVPVSYGYDGGFLYLACASGRKLRNLAANPDVCLTLTDVDSGERWKTVVVEARAEAIDTTLSRLDALRTIHRQRAGDGTVTLADLRRAASAAVFRLVPHQISGRLRA
jgi:uncharacterized protein